MGNGEFDGLSVENLRAMLANADPDKLTAAGTALGDAGPKILDIGSDLRRHVSRVDWTGEGGSAFREWAHDFALEVMRFGQFTSTVGQHVAQAGQALSETKSAMPESRAPGPRAAHEDPAAQDAEQRETEEARHQMERLSSAYRAAQETMAAEREPQFKVLPGPLWDPVETLERRYTSESAGSSASDSAAMQSRSSQELVSAPAATDRAETEPSLHQATGTHIDSTATLPDPEVKTPPRASMPPADQPRQPGPVVMPSPPMGPSTAPPRPTTPVTGKSMSRLPSTERVTGPGGAPPRRLLTPRGPVENDVVGGQQRRLGPSPRLPRAMVVGEESGQMSRGPGGGGGHPMARTTGVPGTEGVASGRRLASEPGGPVSGPRTSNPGISGSRQRGVAIGEENGSHTRGPVSGAASSGGSNAASDSSREAGRGRRVASESGGSIADPRSSSRRGATFTRGGTGLVRPGQAEGQEPSASEASGTGRRGPGHESRQGHAVVDQGAWELGRHDALPPVIE
ncbi:uncharacterized protein YukE [Streptomyces rapamycinicus]|uniref:Uncharacterized protein n=2 Tax=Streptomyces rapamycinicus TaxID=1226757 RepID=A0A3L8RS43_STRRN|nr:uncharacterized protein YukE [Streptomyces rapamycinicus]RLV82359.1 hypothetical protein D3C57_128280 [Streptomyces rapamycinicus NRRL 5491]